MDRTEAAVVAGSSAFLSASILRSCIVRGSKSWCGGSGTLEAHPRSEAHSRYRVGSKVDDVEGVVASALRVPPSKDVHAALLHTPL